MALRFVVKKAGAARWCKNSIFPPSFRGTTSCITTSRHEDSGAMMTIRRHRCNCCTDPPSKTVDLTTKNYDPLLFTLPAFEKYYNQLKATLGFGIDVDLGDYPNVIRPFHGPLDSPELTTRARFAVHQHNISDQNGAAVRFEKVVKANRLGDQKYFLIFHGFDESQKKKKRYRALVEGDQETNFQLKRFDLYGDADEPLVLYHTRVNYLNGFIVIENPSDDLISKYRRVEHIFPKDYFKYCKQVRASQGFDVDDNLDLGDLEGSIFPMDASRIGDPEIIECAQYSVKEYNRHQKAGLQLVSVEKGTHQLWDVDFMYYLTCEVDGGGQRKTLLAQVFYRGLEGVKKVTLMEYRLVDKNGAVINHFKRMRQGPNLSWCKAKDQNNVFYFQNRNN
ncbi:unnamed protein product [Cuscuta epithymum]|uniref:Cystatin domain-containing protein n=1 Tax=Cuscuta epithymum TaxID=186058 RepID=A0AAV0EM29_9ASTE|nr:unnamed protein product [Cuscuta epithymum]